MQYANTFESFSISTKIIRKMLEKISKNKLVELDSVCGEILIVGG
jgi:hypothetical protein